MNDDNSNNKRMMSIRIINEWYNSNNKEWYDSNNKRMITSLMINELWYSNNKRMITIQTKRMIWIIRAKILLRVENQLYCRVTKSGMIVS